MQSDIQYMRRALELAKAGQNQVHRNPLVGSIIVKNGEIVAEGAHEQYGGPHAEVNALQNVSEDPAGATMYVNLEPCTYDGKTPPCVPQIIEAGIQRIVIGTQDPNPRVNGAGIRQLREAGLEVEVGMLEEESRELNRGFFTQMHTGYPWVTLKLALTIDGFMAESNGNSRWITGDGSRKKVHQWRAEHNAILVGSGTVNIDDPQLTVREVSGRNPIRVIIDPKQNIPENARVLGDEARTVLFQPNKTRQNHYMSGVDVFTVSVNKQGKFDWDEVLKKLYDEHGILSVFVEGGAEIASTLIESERVNELIIMTGPKILGSGLSPFHRLSSSLDTDLNMDLVSVEKLGNDVCSRYHKRNGIE